MRFWLYRGGSPIGLRIHTSSSRLWDFAGSSPSSLPKVNAHLDADPVFGVKSSLIVDFNFDGTDARGRPHFLVEYDFVLEPA